MSLDCVTILSSDNDDVQVIESSPVLKPVKIKPECKNGETANEIRRIPLQLVTGKQTFTKFMEKCRSVDPSKDMERVIDKLWKKFCQATEEFTSSGVFIDLVEKAMKSVPTEPYYQLKLVADELSHNKKIQSKSKPNEELPCSSSKAANDAESEMDPKTAMHIKKLERTVEILHRRIQKLENNEVDFNSSDEENSAYIQVSRYKERLCQVYEKICEIQSKDPHAERPLRKHIKFSGTNVPVIDRAIEKFYNDRREFPDYRDILNVVKKANEVKNLNLRPFQIEDLAQRAFQEFGKTLKKWRIYDDIEVFNSYCTNQEDDPASQDEKLRSTLEDNKKKFGNRIDEVIDKYALKQSEENIQPEIVISDDQSESGEEEEEEEPDSDCRSHSSILECKSVKDSSESDNESVPECTVCLTDVRCTAEWKKYMERLENQSKKNSESAATITKEAVVEIERLPPWLSRKRSLSDDEQPSTSKKLKPCDDVIEPIASTSKHNVPIVLGDYRHISEKDHIPSTSKADVAEPQQNIDAMSVDDTDVIEVVSDSCDRVENETASVDADDKQESEKNILFTSTVDVAEPQNIEAMSVDDTDVIEVVSDSCDRVEIENADDEQESEKENIPCTSTADHDVSDDVAEPQQNIETMSVDDTEVIEVISDSCDKVVNEKGSDDANDENQSENIPSDSLSKKVISVDFCTEESEEKSQEKDTLEDSLSLGIITGDVEIDKGDTETNTNEDIAAENLVDAEIQEVEPQTLCESTDSSSAKQLEKVITVDISIDDKEGNAKTNSTPVDESTIVEEPELVQDSTEKESAEETPNSDLSNTNELSKKTDKENEKEQPAKNSLQDNENDEVMIIDEVVKTPPKINQKKPDEVIDVEEIADSPQKPKKLTQMTLGPVNLTQIIRNMQFNKTVNSSNAQQKNRIPIPSTSRNDPRLNKPNFAGKELALINPGMSNQKSLSRPTPPYNTRNNKLTNSLPVRPQTNFMNANQRRPLNNNQFSATNTRNLQQFFANNRNVTLQPAQASMQKRHCTTHTIQQQKFDKRSNVVVTRKQVTTVVEESIMTIDNSKLPNNSNRQFQVFGQRTRVVNRRIQHVQRSTRSNVNNVSEDVITLD